MYLAVIYLNVRALLLKVFQNGKKINVINIPILETVILHILHWPLTN